MAAVPDGVRYRFSTHTAGNIDAFAEILVPVGEIVAIDDPDNLDLAPLTPKSITWHWELMFTRSLFQTPDMTVQHDVLETVAELGYAGTVRSTMTTELTPFDAATVRHAHQLLEGGHTVGKVVVAGFEDLGSPEHEVGPRRRDRSARAPDGLPTASPRTLRDQRPVRPAVSEEQGDE